MLLRQFSYVIRLQINLNRRQLAILHLEFQLLYYFVLESQLSTENRNFSAQQFVLFLVPNDVWLGWPSTGNKEAAYDHHKSKQGIKIIPIHTRLTANTVPTIKPYPLVNLFRLTELLCVLGTASPDTNATGLRFSGGCSPLVRIMHRFS